MNNRFKVVHGILLEEDNCCLQREDLYHNLFRSTNLTLQRIIIMGMKWGQLAKMRHVIQYRISPYEQNIFAGAISKGLPNLWRRIRSQIFIIPPPFIVGYLIYDWGTKENERLKRKNPADYADDK